MSKLTISLKPAEGQSHWDFGDVTRKAVDGLLAEPPYSALIVGGQLSITWYDDQPTSVGVAVTATFDSLLAFDALANLQIALRKKGFDVFVVLGY